MITITRVSDPNDLALMIPHFVVETEDQRRQVTQQIVKALLESPDRLFVVQAKRDEELIGFLVAQNIGSCVYVAQAWSNPSNGWPVADAMWERTVLWTVAIGKPEIRAETKRESEALYRRFGFEEVSKTIAFKVPDGLMNELVAALKEVSVG